MKMKCPKSRSKEAVLEKEVMVSKLIKGFIVSLGDDDVFHQCTVLRYCADRNICQSWARLIINSMIKQVSASRISKPHERKAAYKLVPLVINEPERFSAATKERLLMSCMSRSAEMARLVRSATTTSQTIN